MEENSDLCRDTIVKGLINELRSDSLKGRAIRTLIGRQLSWEGVADAYSLTCQIDFLTNIVGAQGQMLQISDNPEGGVMQAIALMQDVNLVVIAQNRLLEGFFNKGDVMVNSHLIPGALTHYVLFNGNHFSRANVAAGQLDETADQNIGDAAVLTNEERTETAYKNILDNLSDEETEELAVAMLLDNVEEADTVVNDETTGISEEEVSTMSEEEQLALTMALSLSE